MIATLVAIALMVVIVICRRGKTCQEICHYMPLPSTQKEIMCLTYSYELEMNHLAEEVLRAVFSYMSPSDINLF